jgi:tRNA-dihydrouridine synthase B
MPAIGPYTLPNRFILAPMAGVSEQPFRVIAFGLGAALCPTELVSAAGLFHANQRTLRYLRHDEAVEKPYSLQLFGGSPEQLAHAAALGKAWGAQIIDINMGCPVKKVTKSGAGSALLCDPPRAAAIVRAIREATGLPVTAKIRLGWDTANRNYPAMAEVLEDAGCAALAMHARTRAQGYSGTADWQAIGDLKRRVRRMAVIGNGDVKTPEDARRMLETTGCDFVMIGRGALGYPWIFRELAGGPPPSAQERCELVLRHFQGHLSFVGDARAAVRQFRKHLAWYAHGLHGAAAFRAEVNHLDLAEQVELSVRRFFAQAERDGLAGTEQELDYRTALG